MRICASCKQPLPLTEEFFARNKKGFATKCKACRVNKYRNVITQVDEYIFDSKREANRYSELKLLLRANMIRDLELQPTYELLVNGKKIGKYIADFRYVETKTGNVVVEDVKSVATKTPVYQLKKKLIKALYDIDIVEV
jgi:hypothetical protein